MKIYYLLATPTIIACAGGVFTSSSPHSFFEETTKEKVSSRTHGIAWSGGTPGQGKPNLIKKSDSEILSVKTAAEKDAALNRMISAIDAERDDRMADGNIFSHNGAVYFIDFRAMVFAFFSATIDPEYTIQWKTASKGANGIENTYVTLDKDGIMALIQACIGQLQNIWDAADVMKKEVKAIRLDDKKTAEDIENYKIAWG